jgi:hypothetical protein
MGHRVTQRILVCGDCGRTPEDGEYMWEMCGEYICTDCIDKEDEDETED